MLSRISFNKNEFFFGTLISRIFLRKIKKLTIKNSPFQLNSISLILLEHLDKSPQKLVPKYTIIKVYYNKKSNMHQIQKQEQLKQLISQRSNKDIKEIKITFRFLHIFIQGGEKMQYIFGPNAKLLEVKRRLDEDTKRNFIFYLRESFIPSLDSRVGDIAFCYGRKENDNKYELTLAASENPYQYG